MASRPRHIRTIQGDAPVETPGRSKVGSEDVWPVGGGYNDDVGIGIETSISTSIWLRVCSRSSCEPPSAPRWRPMHRSHLQRRYRDLSLGLVEQSRTDWRPRRQKSDEIPTGDREEGTPASPRQLWQARSCLCREADSRDTFWNACA